MALTASIFFASASPWGIDNLDPAFRSLAHMPYYYPPRADSQESDPEFQDPDTGMLHANQDQQFTLPMLPSNGLPQQQHGPLSMVEDSDSTLRRSTSMPSLLFADQQRQVHQTGGSGDKKKNKLGYHRTSIACRHCRKRKIRCIPSPDINSPCRNCVRLKRDCAFCPVDQQVPREKPGKGPPSQASPSSKANSSKPPSPSGSDLRNLPSRRSSRGSASGPRAKSLRIDSVSSSADPMEDHILTSPIEDEPPRLPYMFTVGDHPTPWTQPQVSHPEAVNGVWRGYPAQAPLSQTFRGYANVSMTPNMWARDGNMNMTPQQEAQWQTYPVQGRPVPYNADPMSYMDQSSGAMAMPRPMLERRASDMGITYQSPMIPNVRGESTMPSVMRPPFGQRSQPPAPTQSPAMWQGQNMGGYTMPFPRDPRDFPKDPS